MQNRNQAIQCLTDHLIQLEARRNSLVNEIEKEIEHVRGALTSLRNTAPEAPAVSLGELVSDFPIGKIRNMTQVQALMTIARHQGGVIRAQEAKRLLIRAGVMRQTKNSTNIIHSVIVRSERFEKVRPGEYRLKEQSQKAQDENNFFHQPAHVA